MDFGSLVPGMMPMQPPRQNALMGQGMQLLNMAQRARQPGPGGMPPQGLLQRLLNPGAPPPMNLAAPGQPPNGPPAPSPTQMGLLARMFGGGQPGGAPPMPQPAPPVATPGLGGLY